MKATTTRWQMILMLVWMGTFRNIDAREVSIPDPVLNAFIREALGKPVGMLTEDALLDLRTLYVEHQQVSSLAGLEAAPNLTKLTLRNTQLTNVALPGNLAKLVTLDLTGNRMTTLTLPAGL